MFQNVAPFDEIWSRVSKGARGKSIAAFVHFLERRLQARLMYDGALVPLGDTELIELAALAQKLQSKGIITGWGEIVQLPDEPPLFSWYADCASVFEREEPLGAGGASIASNQKALIATLAEALERYVWNNEQDYFQKPTVATVAQMAGKRIIAPERFAGFSTAQREKRSDLRLRADAPYLWIRGHSWVANKPVWLPAQVVSGSQEVATARRARNEPLVLHSITHGLATRETRESAVLHGALELLERDAFMIAWFNQISAPRFDLNELALRSYTLGGLLRQCERYRLRPSAMRLPTDAPTYAALGVIEDETGHSPAFTVGLKAHRDAASAVEGALLEALRNRSRVRTMRKSPKLEWDAKRKPHDIGHNDRLLYWSEADRSKRLEFLREGPVQQWKEPWERDTEAHHLARILAWAQERGYEFASISMTGSKGNPTPWHIEMIVMPELQPLHLSEKLAYLGGARLSEIPRQFGYTARATPFADEPHPFA